MELVHHKAGLKGQQAAAHPMFPVNDGVEDSSRRTSEDPNLSGPVSQPLE